ncbi:MAG: hypothetical protein ABR587_08400 [Candidatus Binatia bacterium]
MSVRKIFHAVAAAAAAGLLIPASAFALDFDLKGSLGEAGFTHYVSPVSNPLFNETPLITTEIRPMWIHQEIPDAFASSGGDIDVLAVQIRVAITDRLGFIATKDGWADVDFDDLLESEGGAVNLAFGFKYAVLADAATNSILTVGIKYEAPTGGIKTQINGVPSSGLRLQGQGDGLLDIFVAGARSFGPLGLEANLGTQVAMDMGADMSFLHYAFHVDYDVMGRVFPLLELNGYTPINDGGRSALGANGMDLVNMGASNADTVVTFAPGVRARVINNVDFGFSYELPLTDEKDLMDWRVTTDFVIHM